MSILLMIEALKSRAQLIFLYLFRSSVVVRVHVVVLRIIAEHNGAERYLPQSDRPIRTTDRNATSPVRINRTIDCH